jgi:hypothetical protein
MNVQFIAYRDKKVVGVFVHFFVRPSAHSSTVERMVSLGSDLHIASSELHWYGWITRYLLVLKSSSSKTSSTRLAHTNYHQFVKDWCW